MEVISGMCVFLNENRGGHVMQLLSFNTTGRRIGMYKDIYAEMQIQDAEERQRLGNISLCFSVKKQWRLSLVCAFFSMRIEGVM
jgi:hypothetical protein